MVCDVTNGTKLLTIFVQYTYQLSFIVILWLFTNLVLTRWGSSKDVIMVRFTYKAYIFLCPTSHTIKSLDGFCRVFF